MNAIMDGNAAEAEKAGSRHLMNSITNMRQKFEIMKQ